MGGAERTNPAETIRQRNWGEVFAGKGKILPSCDGKICRSEKKKSGFP
jgi:hypothetical protein